MENNKPDYIRIISEATMISIPYGILLGIRGYSWFWLLDAIVMLPVAMIALVWRIENGKPRNFLKLLLYTFFELLTIVLLAPLALRLAFYSGFWGFIQSILHLNWLGIIFAIISIYWGRELCIIFNKVYRLLK